ncbi:MAG: coenzyme F420-0:L-glutamate ligase [Methanomicrobiales archaeon]|nr:coenzyme F420-0:L-glutamate ligase [Methanomicrobiales archaeon]
MHICYYALETGLIRAGDDLASRIAEACRTSECHGLRQGDVIVVAESAVATSEGRVIRLEDVEPGRDALEYALRYEMDPSVVEVILAESDRVIGGIPGFLLCMKNGTLLPNAGVDQSNAPDGCVIPLPERPDMSASRIRGCIKDVFGVDVGVIIADSRTHAMRLGCAGVAIGCAGIPSVLDERGRRDLYGRELKVTRRALADCIASAAEILMGEADECIPAVVVRGLGLPISDISGVDSIDASECLFMGVALHSDPSLFGGK